MKTKTKRPTKAQREAAELEYLRQRICDIYWGAYGGYDDTDPAAEDFPGFPSAGAEIFARFVGAVQRQLVPEGEQWRRSYHLEKYDTLETLAAWLHRSRSNNP